MVGAVVDAGDHRAWGFALWRERDLSRTARRLSRGEERHKNPVFNQKLTVNMKGHGLKEREGDRGDGTTTSPDQLIEKRSTGGWRSTGGCRGRCVCCHSNSTAEHLYLV